jgi:hypothetical protein
MRWLLLCALVACRSSSPSSPSNRAEPDYKAIAADELGFLPAASEIVVGIDFVQLKGSALWQKFQPLLLAQIPMIDTYRKSCGFDPVQTIERITFAGNMAGANRFVGIVVVRGVDSARGIECINKNAQQIGTVKDDGGVLVVKQKNMIDPMAVMAVDPMTVVIQVDANVNAGTQCAFERAGAPLRSSPVFMNLYERREKGASAWAMANGNSKLFEPVAGMGVKPKSADGTLTITDKFTTTIRATFNTPDEAKKLADDINKTAGMAKRFVEKLNVRADGPTVIIDGAVTEAQLRTIMSMAGGMLGGP